jgi:hypothetical protein
LLPEKAGRTTRVSDSPVAKMNLTHAYYNGTPVGENGKQQQQE